MEDTLRVLFTLCPPWSLRLNPCFNGRYSQRVTDVKIVKNDLVLILVLMEDTLREQVVIRNEGSFVS